MLDGTNILPIGALARQRHLVPVRAGDDIPRHYCVIQGEAGPVCVAYGHLPVGAVLLVRQSFDPGSKTVAAMQSFIFDDPMHSMWSHVAIVGEGLRVWDIMPDEHVREQSMGEFLSECDLLAARALKGVFFDPDDLQRHIVEQRGSTYPNLSQPHFVQAFLAMMMKGRQPPRFNSGELVCSTFVDRILRVASRIEILPDDRPPLALPGHFARSSAFVDVPLSDCAFRLD